MKAERDSNNNPLHDMLPPVYPGEIASLRTSVLISDVLEPFRPHIFKHWSVEEVDQIEKDHKDLVTAVKTDRKLKQKLGGHSKKTMFNDAWD